MNEKIRAARKSKNISTAQLSNQLQLSDGYICDIESYDDEIYDNLSLGDFKRLCSILALDPIDILQDLGLQRIDVSSLVGEFITSAKKTLEFSNDKIAEQIGFETWVVDEIMQSNKNINKLPLNVCLELFECLHLPPSGLFSKALSPV